MQIKSVLYRDRWGLPTCAYCRKRGQLLTNWFDVKEGHFFFPAVEKKPWLYVKQSVNHLTSNYNYLQHPTVSSISTPTGPTMQLFRHHRCVFGFLFHFNRGEIGNIFFYSPLAPLESLLSFGLFMKNYFMLTYICRLFSPSVTHSRFSSISKALKPILYVCRSAFAIESRLKYQCVVGKVWQEETNDLLLCQGPL